jgi:hypothetical protein
LSIPDGDKDVFDKTTGEVAGKEKLEVFLGGQMPSGIVKADLNYPGRQRLVSILCGTVFYCIVRKTILGSV